MFCLKRTSDGETLAARMVPATFNAYCGVVVPMPTRPAAGLRIRSPYAEPDAWIGVPALCTQDHDRGSAHRETVRGVRRDGDRGCQHKALPARRSHDQDRLRGQDLPSGAVAGRESQSSLRGDGATLQSEIDVQ